MTLDSQLSVVLAAMAGNPPLTGHPPARARAVFDELARGLHAAAGPPLAVKETHDLQVAGVPVRVYRPDTAGEVVPTVVFVHGGGWVIGSIDSHDDHARRLCHDLGAVVVSVGYRLAPEHPFPAGVDDVTAVFDAVAADLGAYGGERGPLGVAGDSAGGNLAAVLALHARDTGVDLAAQLLVYPATDLGTEFASLTENADGYFLTRADTLWFAGHYLGGDPARTTDPRVSPARVDTLVGLAPAVVVTAQYDPLRDDGDAYAALLDAAGVTVVHRRFDGLVHGFMGMTGLSAACEDATAWTVEAFGTLLRA